ncbi:hypothetical protein E2562_026613 [Oryza meyeriana var. granulata]|uniref:Uncharacterized protein n=1 Tax=Oryza meyeriana var. granulata TaxID=110450 RepID=A0A6G1CTB2_9ORYZ|nr:hypothetical protein E2562_026613 [Oryza meyeriana var. granulata]
MGQRHATSTLLDVDDGAAESMTATGSAAQLDFTGDRGGSVLLDVDGGGTELLMATGRHHVASALLDVDGSVAESMTATGWHRVA